ncbi:cysteine desulfurase [Thalassotalea sp. M1531]|uniref:Probable cysteine desulfurase n=1 Tax=Thalassotalea algicola TaxID=2716224 RepID=A0A7Y0Q5D0_9GAMM|nr:cysteine desulfurase [Thalassotalea algicola]NMP30904.1 cysteine desulfurase [Thalassotalea algicola]
MFDDSHYPSSSLPPLHYLDSAATCLIPEQVVAVNQRYLQFEHANSHRGFYPLSSDLTDRVENTRQQVASFINAPCAQQIIFTSGATSAIHQIVQGYFADKIAAKHNIVTTVAEHHANFVPWQQLAQSVGAELRIAPVKASGEVDIELLTELIDENTLLLTISHLSNVTGVENPLEQIINQIKSINSSVKVVVDGAQYIGHYPLDVSTLGCDFYVFSGHKLYAGFGVGVLFCHQRVIEAMSPVVFGGGMVERVTNNQSLWQTGIRRFEAGSLNAQAIVALAAAIEYIQFARSNDAQLYMSELSNYLRQRLSAIGFCQFLVATDKATPIVGFNLKGIHSHDVASILAEHNVAIRAGHHCAQPLHSYLNKNSSIRVSLALYNEQQDIDAMIDGLEKAHTIMAV